jgi:hypothetical protein
MLAGCHHRPGARSACWRGCAGRGVASDRPVIPARIGPVEFGELAGLVAVRCPREFDVLMCRAGGRWEPGSRRWLVGASADRSGSGDQ